MPRPVVTEGSAAPPVRKCVAPASHTRAMTQVVLATPIGGLGGVVEQGAGCAVSFGAVPGGEPPPGAVDRGGAGRGGGPAPRPGYFAPGPAHRHPPIHLSPGHA